MKGKYGGAGVRKYGFHTIQKEKSDPESAQYGLWCLLWMLRKKQCQGICGRYIRNILLFHRTLLCCCKEYHLWNYIKVIIRSCLVFRHYKDICCTTPFVLIFTVVVCAFVVMPTVTVVVFFRSV